jgi:hypothetical protein
VVFKRLRERSTKRLLSLVEVFRDHADLVQGYNFEPKGIEIEPSDDEAILEGVQEAAALAVGELHIGDEDRALIRLFEALPDETMPLKYQRTRPTLAALRDVSAELRESALRTEAVPDGKLGR